MPSKVPIAYIDIRFFIHATEDVDKVLDAVNNLLATQSTGQVVFKETNLKGHYNNPITLMETRIKKKDIVKAVFEKIASSINALDKELLSNEIAKRLNKRSLFLRLDKQSAYLNEFKLCLTDPVHFRIRFRKSGLEEIVEICRKFGMLP